MRLSLPQWVVCAALAATTLITRADTFIFLISTGSTSTTPGTTFIVNGTLTGTPDPTIPGAIDLTGITGSGQGYTFNSIVPVGAVPTLTYDNLLFPDNTAVVDSEGVLVSLTSPIGTSLARVFDNNGYEVDVFDPNDPGDITPFTIQTFTVTAAAVTTPEPATLFLASTGALGLFVALKLRSLHA
jgi:hypothetical protein